MEGNTRSSRYGLKTLMILGAAAGIISCASKAEVAALKTEVDALKAYREKNAIWLDSLYKSYAHVYECDTDHKIDKKCPQAPDHIAPPGGPPK